MEFISDSIARCHVAESTDADASSYDVGSPASVKKIPREYLSRGCDSLSDLRGMIGLVATGVGVSVRWSKADSFGYAKSVDSVREFFNRPFGRLVHNRLIEHYIRTSDDLSVLAVP